MKNLIQNRWKKLVSKFTGVIVLGPDDIMRQGDIIHYKQEAKRAISPMIVHGWAGRPVNELISYEQGTLDRIEREVVRRLW
ncbi:MAG: hypothetical protein JRE40_00200 [Deltaproteobacteria bacterium]|nr:hypothetical protein [Deltaproteobacteria bacterium]